MFSSQRISSTTGFYHLAIWEATGMPDPTLALQCVLHLSVEAAEGARNLGLKKVSAVVWQRYKGGPGIPWTMGWSVPDGVHVVQAVGRIERTRVDSSASNISPDSPFTKFHDWLIPTKQTGYHQICYRSHFSVFKLSVHIFTCIYSMFVLQLNFQYYHIFWV